MRDFRMQVYGVTYDSSTNYGSCFQGYALQYAVEHQTIENETCEYRQIPIAQMPDYHLKTVRLTPKGTIYKWVSILFCESKFRSFYHTFMKYAKCQSIKELGSLNETADAFVCGSDVIWDPEFNFRIGAYYLDFAEKYSFSYAASFGKMKAALPGEKETAWLRKLDQISCREHSGAEIIKRITGSMPPVVADPVLLLTKEEWEEIMPGDMKTPEHYIFAYNTYLMPEYDAFLRRLSLQTGLPVIRSTWRLHNYRPQKIRKTFTPPEWLYLLNHADYVVTNSFHATAFATIFQKNFYTIVRGNAATGSNVRIYEYLNALGLENRIVSGMVESVDASAVDYHMVPERIAAMREESAGFLQDNLKAAYLQKHKG